MDMNTSESLGDAASILVSFASVAENSVEQQSVLTEAEDVVNNVNRQAQIEQLVDGVGSFQQQIQTHEQQSQPAGAQQQPMQQQLLWLCLRIHPSCLNALAPSPLSAVCSQ